ncbi:hypothetical protein [Flavobacterium sp.]|uniref:hypothetical protein n=1 Tax=Flavobacterium sp. TaxID=239 RepID=UPI00262EBA22|nr:hypothetical protein [Flavobacterium sp.]
MMQKYFKQILVALFVFTTAIIQAQAPQKMSYQSVIRNASGDLVTDTPIGIRISIVKDGPEGTAVYVETHNTTTNENGLASIEIGGGTPVTGTFSAINWGGGNYFIKTETDPEGGSNYSIVGTSQLLSVPYALYSGSSLNQGKTTIFITGDITDAEAAAQLQAQFGSNTENIIIENTTQLTTVDLSMVTQLLDLTISSNQQLASVNLNHLTTIFRDAIIDLNPMLTSLDLPLLNTISKLFAFYNNESMVTLAFPSLTKIRSSGRMEFNGNQSLATVSFPQLLIGTSLTFNANASLTSVNFDVLNTGFVNFEANPLLTNVQADVMQSGQLTVNGSDALSTINLPVFTSGNVYIDGDNLSTFNVPLIQSGGISITGGLITELDFPLFTDGSLHVSSVPALSSVNLPALQQCAYVNFYYTGITSLTLPSLTSVDTFSLFGNVNIQQVNLPMLSVLKECNVESNPQLAIFDMPVLSSVGGAGNRIDLRNNHLPTSVINDILSKVSAATPSSSKTLWIEGQSPPAPPTGQGIIDKQALIDAGNTVTTD